MISKLRFLKPDEYPQWDDLVDNSPQGSVFCYSWWLKATGDDIYILGYFDKGRLIAGIPLFYKYKYGIKICTMPKLTPTWGIVIEPLKGKLVNNISKEMEILRTFAEYLSNEKIFTQSFHSQLQNWLPFYWKGFKQTTGCTYIFEALTDLDKIWSGMRENIRTDIKKAEKKEIKITTCSSKDAYNLFEKSFKRQSLKLTYDIEYFERLYHAASGNYAGECFVAKDNDGLLHAAAFLVWDKKCAYYLIGGGDPDLRNSGATSLLIWHLIKFAGEKSEKFDFEGSLIEPIERFFRAFGAKQTYYNIITKRSKIFKLF